MDPYQPEPAASLPASHSGLYYLTNNYNLREILSSGFIAGIYSYDTRYAPDLLALCPGRIPLFKGAVHTGFPEKVRVFDPGTCYPVLLELSAGLSVAGFPVYPGNNGDGPVLGGECIAFAGVISTDSVTAIHFLNEHGREEFAVRAFAEYSDFSGLFRVSPHVTEAGVPGREADIARWLQELPVAQRPDGADFHHADRRSGAAVLCAQWLARHSAREKAAVRHLITMAGAPSRPPRAARLPKVPSALPVWFALGFGPRDLAGLGTRTDAQGVLFAAVVNVLHRVNLREDGRRTAILSSIEAEVLPFIDENERMRLADLFERARMYLRNDLTFEPFRPSTGYEVAKALLLFLITPDTETLAGLRKEETGADNQVMLTAVAFAGIANGRRSLPVTLRPERLDAEVVQQLARSLSELQVAEATVKSPRKKRAPKSETVASPSVSEPLSAAAPPLAPDLQELYASDLTTPGPRREDAIRLCLSSEWQECLSTVLLWPGPGGVTVQQLLPGQPGGPALSLRLPGIATVSYELETDIFKDRLLQYIQEHATRVDEPAKAGVESLEVMAAESALPEIPFPEPDFLNEPVADH